MKAILRVGYKEYVMSMTKAAQIMELLEAAERYESKWHKAENGRESCTTYHVYPDDADHRGNLEVITDAFYNMCKMAGKPQD